MERSVSAGIPGYFVTGKLGSGSDSEVYECIEKSTGRQVAVKVIPKHGPGGRAPPPCAAAANKEDRLERSRREAEVLELLGDHPNIVRMHQSFETEDTFFIVLEHAGGGDLFEVLYSHELNPTQTVLEERCARRIFTQTCLAVSHMHRKGVCHRDLKPENIFLDSEWNVKVGDFGLSLCFEPDQFSADPVGSLIYASPEVLRREPYIGPELDVYALGVLLYEMLCGMPPFVGETERDLCNAILAGEYTIPSFVSPGARSLISKMIKLKKYRISMEEVLNHPWILEGLPSAVLVQRRSRKRRGSLLSPSVEETRSPRGETAQRAGRKKRKEGSTRTQRKEQIEEEVGVRVCKPEPGLESDCEGRAIAGTEIAVPPSLCLERPDEETPSNMLISGEVITTSIERPLRVLDDEEDATPGGTESPVPPDPEGSSVSKDDEIAGKLSGELSRLKLKGNEQPTRATKISLLREGPVPPLRSLSSPTVRV